MIDLVLKTIRDEIQTFLNLKVKAALGEEKIVLQPVADQDGKNKSVENQVSMSLVKIEEDRVFTSHIQSSHVNENNRVEYSNPPIRLNLYILFAAAFSDYSESLKFISHIVSFFQTKPVFTSSNSPALDPKIKKISFEIFDQSMQDISFLWGMMGSSYLPSVLYKMRLLTFQEGQITKTGAVSTDTEQQIEQQS